MHRLHWENKLILLVSKCTSNGKLLCKNFQKFPKRVNDLIGDRANLYDINNEFLGQKSTLSILKTCLTLNIN